MAMKKKTGKNTDKKVKMEGTVSKGIQKTAGIDLAIDVLCPPLGAIRHFKRSMKVAETVKTAEKAVDVILGDYAFDELANIGGKILETTETSEPKEEEVEEMEEK